MIITYKDKEIPISDTNFVDDVAIINIEETGEIICLPMSWATVEELELIRIIKEDVESRPIPEIDIATLNANIISELKQKLSETDYVVIKIAEGVATAEDYADVIAQRQSWRDEINELESV